MDDVTPKRKTYHVAVVIRPEGAKRGPGPIVEEKVREGKIRAIGPVSAHRGVLEQTWSGGWLVSRFLSVECLD